VKRIVPELSGRARRDLDEIREWTIKTWSREQWQDYYRGMGAAFRRIASEPDCGRPRGLLGKEMRSLLYGRHLIFFAPLDDFAGKPVILRILHQRRNLAALTYHDDLEG
jgi:toxin ParE1/3/4